MKNLAHFILVAVEGSLEGQRPGLIKAQHARLGCRCWNPSGLKARAMPSGPTARLIKAQPAGLGCRCWNPSGLKARVMYSGPTARFIIAQPAGLGIIRAKPCGLKARVMPSGPTARLIIAQPAGLGYGLQNPCGLKARVIARHILTRTFSPHEFAQTKPSPLGWAIMKPGLRPFNPTQLSQPCSAP